jgi:ribosomal protein S17E
MVSTFACFTRARLLLTVVASHETKSVVDKVTRKTNKATRNRVCGSHLSDTIVHQTQEASVNRISEEQAGWATLVETAADTDEERSSNGAANGHELNLSIPETSVKVIIVLNDLAFFVAVGASDRLGRHKVVDLLAMFV